jgi:hypothetical protein
VPVFDPSVFDSGVFDTGGGALEVFRDARIPVEARGIAQVYRDAVELVLEARGWVYRDARIPVEAAGETVVVVFRDARIPIEAGQLDSSALGFRWKVLQPADFVQAFIWTVVEVVTVGGELHFRWRVFQADAGQGFTWTVIPADLIDLFESQGVGAAAGIARDTLLPIGRATKD